MWNIFKRKKKAIESYGSHITEETVNTFNETYKAYLQDKCMFRMTPVEYLRYTAFSQEHKNCKGQVGIVFYPGIGLGNIVHCVCPACKTEVSITNFENW